MKRVQPVLRPIGVTLAVLLGGCAQPPAPAIPADKVILLPGRDGSTGAVLVQQGGGQTVLDSAYATARAGAGGLEVGQTDASALKKEFSAALSALPPAPMSFVVYFVFAQDELTEDSRKEFEPVLQELARRPAAEITVIGHADQAGPERINETLSLRRAERVKELLLQRGVRPDRIIAVGRGAREPAIRAPEGTSGARNRRVEISVR